MLRSPRRDGPRRWWGGQAERGDAGRLEAFSDGVMAIAITLLILDVHVARIPGQSLAAGLGHALPQIIGFAATFLQIGIMWANHHALFRIVDKVDQLLLLLNLVLLAGVSFLPFPAQLIASYPDGSDARTAMLLYGGVLTFCALAFNIIWHYASKRGLLHDDLDAAFHRDVTIRYRIGLAGYAVSTLLALLTPWLTLAVSAALALLFLLGPSPRPAFPTDEP
jgi:uncharacterized membrane protein